MAVGEYTSVASQRDILQRQIDLDHVGHRGHLRGWCRDDCGSVTVKDHSHPTSMPSVARADIGDGA